MTEDGLATIDNILKDKVDTKEGSIKVTTIDKPFRSYLKDEKVIFAKT